MKMSWHPPRRIELLHKRDGDVRSPLEPRRHRQFLRAQELRIEQLGLITRAVVAKDGDDGVAGAELAREPDRARDIDAARAAEAQPFVLEQLEDHWHCFLVG